MDTSNRLVLEFNFVNGCLAVAATLLVLYTLYKTCRYHRNEKTQDAWGTFFQNWFHICMYSAVFLIGFDRLVGNTIQFSYLSEFVSPPLIEFSVCMTAFCWCGYRLRRYYLKTKGHTLMEDLQVKHNEESGII